MRNLTIVLAISLFVALIIVQTAGGEAPADFDYNSAIERLKDYSRSWHSHERAQELLHKEAERERWNLCKYGYIEFCITDPNRQAIVNVTNYNPEVGQTDASPCIGAGLTDICHIAKTEKVIALSQDLVGRASWKKFTYGDYVLVEHDYDHCSGVYRIEDTMNKRFYKRADIFHLSREDNFGICRGATIKKVIPYDII